MRQKYRDYNPRGNTLKMVEVVNQLITNYQAQGFTLSVRQLYYQLVTRNLIANTEQSYKRVANMINDARLGGLIDWDAIEDRNRDVVVRGRWGSGSSILDACASSYHMDMWLPQEQRVFVIVEKAALAGVLEGVCSRYDVPMLAARGYPSVSILRELAMQHIRPALRAGQEVTVLHLGDHDPSGLDMTRDLTERLELFSNDSWFHYDIHIERIALSMEQIEEKNPPPNPAKTSDARFDEYARQYGDESWELDALEPSYLVNLVTTEIEARLDPDVWKERQDQIDDVKSRIKVVAENFAQEGV